MTLLTELKEGLAIAWDAVRANTLRSVLTTLGIIIGIVTVTLMGTVIDGLNRAFRESVAMLGADTLYVSRTGWFVESYEEWRRLSARRTITLRQARRLADSVRLSQAVAPVADTMRPVKYQDRQSRSVFIMGSTEQLSAVAGIAVGQGRFLTADEAEGGRPVCVVGFQVATNLFARENPIGQRIKVGFQPFEVVGVLEKQGSFLGAFSVDNFVVVPIRQFISHFWHDPDITIRVRVGDLARLDDAREELRGLLRKIRGVAPGDPDDFAINEQEQIARRLKVVSATIASVGLFITGLSLFVGGIGIMNIMFVSVAERTHEIGIRKAIGAKRRTILVQFLSEAICVCLLGGLIALSVAWPLSLLIGRFMPARMSFWLVGLALLVSLLTGLISGFFPAWRAARMDPVEALRHE